MEFKKIMKDWPSVRWFSWYIFKSYNTKYIFRSAIIHKLFESNSSFHAKYKFPNILILKLFGDSLSNSFIPCLQAITAHRFTLAVKEKFGKISKGLKVLWKMIVARFWNTLSYHESNVSLIARETMRLLVNHYNLC